MYDMLLKSNVKTEKSEMISLKKTNTTKPRRQGLVHSKHTLPRASS